MKAAVFFLAIIIVFWLAGCELPQQRPVVVKRKPLVKTQPKPIVINHDTVCIVAVGDIMLGTAYPNNAQLPPDSARASFKYCLKDLQSADIAFANLEGTLLDKGHAREKKDKSIAHFFMMPVHYGQVIKDAGFNVLSVANNHVGDFGDSGRVSTVRALKKYGFVFAGLRDHPVAVFEKNGVKYGFCAFAPNSATVPLLDFKNAAILIDSLKKHCDIVLVSFHGGAEGAAFEHVPFKRESYVGENRGDVHAFAHAAVDAGADLILGNGPHVSRAVENYKGRLIAYSLGNFCTYKNVSVNGVCGLAPLLKVYLNKKGEFLKGRIISYRQTHQDGLLPDTLNRVAKRIKALTQADFPASGLTITDDGQISVSP